MKKIINTLKDGSFRAKRTIILALLSLLASAGLVVFAIILKQLLIFFGALICVFVTIALFQTLGVYEYEDSRVDKPIKPDYGAMDYEADDEREEDSIGATEEEDLLSQMDRVLNNARIDSDSAEGEDEEFMQMLLEGEDSKEADSPGDKKKEKKRLKNKKNKKKKDKNKKDKKIKFRLQKLKAKESNDDSYEGNPDEEASEETSEEEIFAKETSEEEYAEETYAKEASEEDNHEQQREKESSAHLDEEDKKLIIIKQASDEELATYNKKKIKKTLRRFKVKRDHRLVIIDRCDKFYIKQTPAYIWVADKEFHMLLIEEEPRHLLLPLYSIKAITYLKKQPVNADTDYPAFHKKNMITNLFSPYLPDYTQSTVVTDMTSYKNLYGIGPGIYFTNRSAKNLFDLLSVPFEVEDKVTTSNKVNIYFKEAYKSGVLLRDNVIDANGYADRISNTLDDMARSMISYNEFKDTLNLMMKNKLITQEFAMYYMDVRNKLSKKS